VPQAPFVAIRTASSRTNLDRSLRECDFQRLQVRADHKWPLSAQPEPAPHPSWGAS
jgi:hypothetical protein